VNNIQIITEFENITLPKTWAIFLLTSETVT